MALEDLGRLILAKRNERGLGIRAAAKEVGVSHGTLSRVEKGFLPDLENYEKICRWLGIGVAIESDVVLHQRGRTAGANAPTPQVHFRREKTVTPTTATALAKMIIAAQKAWRKQSS